MGEMFNFVGLFRLMEYNIIFFSFREFIYSLVNYLQNLDKMRPKILRPSLVGTEIVVIFTVPVDISQPVVVKL